MAKGLLDYEDPHALGTVGLQSRDYALAGFDGVDLMVRDLLDAGDDPRAIRARMDDLGLRGGAFPLPVHWRGVAEEFAGDLEISRKQPLERVKIPCGTRVRVQLRPHVVETPDGPVEAADLFFEDGTATCEIPFACFAFVE